MAKNEPKYCDSGNRKLKALDMALGVGGIARRRTTEIFSPESSGKVGVLYGSPEATPGGRALKFYAPVRIDLRIKDRINQCNDKIGNLVNAKVVKDKVSLPFQWVLFEVLFGQRISREGDILDLGQEMGILNKSNSCYQWDTQVLGQGREATRIHLQNRPELTRQIEGLIHTKCLLLTLDDQEKSMEQTLESVLA